MRDGTPRAPGHLEGNLGRAGAVPKPRGSIQVGGDVLVTEPEPRFLAQPGELTHDLPGLAGDPPTLVRLGDAGQRVEDRVVIRADGQGVALQVVAGVDDDRQLARRERPLEAVGELRPTDATRQTDDAHRSSSSTAISMQGRLAPAGAGVPTTAGIGRGRSAHS